ncbi:MAG: insulinase family protein [Candidatus Rhabdochlamydia sp.]
MKLFFRFLCVFFCFNNALFSSYTIINNEQKLDALSPSFSHATAIQIKLPNQLQALLISSPQASQSHVVINVAVGNYQDPKNFPGMAHLIEHLIIQKNGPQGSSQSFVKWLAEKGGTYGAYTDTNCTSYEFSLLDQDLIEGIDKIASLFKEPHFFQENIQKEVTVIEQEYQLRKNAQKTFYCIQQAVNPLHPFSQFKVGNYETLSSIHATDLHSWYQDNYDPSQMHLVIISPQPLETLMTLTETHFSQLMHHKIPSKLPLPPLFSSKNEKKLLRIESMENRHRLSMLWAIPTSLMDQNSSSVALLKMILTKPEQDSFLDLLRGEDLATSFNIKSQWHDQSSAMIEFEYVLTEEGLIHPYEIIERTFQYLQSLKNTEIPSCIWEDFNKKNLIDRYYQYSKDERAVASQLAQDMALGKNFHLNSLTNECKTIKSLLEHLSPTKCLYVLTVPPATFSEENTLIEKWTNTPYTLHSIDASQLAKWAELPHCQIFFTPNPYFPQTLSSSHQMEIPEQQPKKIIDNPMGRVYFLQDQNYQLPQTAVYLNIQAPMIDNTTSSKVLLDLHMGKTYGKMGEELDLMNAAGIQFEVMPRDLDYVVTLSGWSENFPACFEKMMRSFFNPLVSREEFIFYKKHILKKYQNMSRRKILDNVGSIVKEDILKITSPLAHQIEFLESLSYEDYLLKAKSLFLSTYTEATIAGDLSEKEAIHLIEIYSNFIPPSPFTDRLENQKPLLKIENSLEGGIKNIFRPSVYQQPQAAFLLLNPEGSTDLTYAVQQILRPVMKAYFFHFMRTNEKVSYASDCDSWKIKGKNFYIFVAQSTAYTPQEMVINIEHFLEDFIHDLTLKIPYERFLDLKKIAINRVKPIYPRTLPQKVVSLHAHLIKGHLNCECDKKYLQAIENISYDEFIEHARKILSCKNRQKAALLSIPISK